MADVSPGSGARGDAGLLPGAHLQRLVNGGEPGAGSGMYRPSLCENALIAWGARLNCQDLYLRLPEPNPVEPETGTRGPVQR